MEMQIEFIRKLPSPQELMQDYPLGAEALAVKAARDKEIIITTINNETIFFITILQKKKRTVFCSLAKGLPRRSAL